MNVHPVLLHAASSIAEGGEGGFSAVDSHAWHRLMRWIRAKYKQGNHRIGMPELRRRFCDQGWRFAATRPKYSSYRGPAQLGGNRPGEPRHQDSTKPSTGPN